MKWPVSNAHVVVVLLVQCGYVGAVVHAVAVLSVHAVYCVVGAVVNGLLYQ